MYGLFVESGVYAVRLCAEVMVMYDGPRYHGWHNPYLSMGFIKGNKIISLPDIVQPTNEVVYAGSL